MMGSAIQDETLASRSARRPFDSAQKVSRRAHLKGAVAAAGTALLGGLRTGRAGAQAGPVEVAQDLGDGTAQNWLVYPDGRRVPVGCRYDLATGECVAPGATEEIPAPASALPQVSGKVRVWQNDLVDAWKLL